MQGSGFEPQTPPKKSLPLNPKHYHYTYLSFRSIVSSKREKAMDLEMETLEKNTT